MTGAATGGWGVEPAELARASALLIEEADALSVLAATALAPSRESVGPLVASRGLDAFEARAAEALRQAATAVAGLADALRSTAAAYQAADEAVVVACGRTG